MGFKQVRQEEPSQAAFRDGKEPSALAPAISREPKSDISTDKPLDQPVRAINEDDDGYDPYSDYHPSESPYEEDPWR